GLWAYVGPSEMVKSIASFNLLDERCWKRLARDAVMPMKGRDALAAATAGPGGGAGAYGGFPILPYRFSPLPGEAGRDLSPAASALSGAAFMAERVEAELETALRGLLEAHREDHDLGCAFDDHLAGLMGQCLWGCEMGRVMRASGSAPTPTAANSGDALDAGGWAWMHGFEGMSGRDFQEGVRRAIPEGHTFKGFPCHFASHLSASRMFATLGRNPGCAGLLLARGDKVRFALRVRVFPYVERCVACWVMIAVRYKPLE
ncbi:Centrosomal protein of 76 kDa, partial [Irineochytrium annulatum]